MIILMLCDIIVDVAPFWDIPRSIPFVQNSFKCSGAIEVLDIQSELIANSFSRFVNLKLLNFILLSLNRRLIACSRLRRLTASISGCSRPIGLISKTVLLAVGFKLLLLLLELVSRFIKSLFVAESVKRSTFTLCCSYPPFQLTLSATLLDLFPNSSQNPSYPQNNKLCRFAI